MSVTLRLLSTYQGNKPGTILTVDDATGAQLLRGGVNATTDLTGGTVPPTVPVPNQRFPAQIEFTPGGGVVGLLSNGKSITIGSPKIKRLANSIGTLPQYNGTQAFPSLTASLTPANVNVTTSSIEQNVTVTGLLPGDIITDVSFGGTQTAGIAIAGWRVVNATAGTVGLMFKNSSGATVAPAPGVYTFKVARLTGATGNPHFTIVGVGSATLAAATTTLTGAVVNYPLTSPKIRRIGRLSDWSIINVSNAGIYGPGTNTVPTGPGGLSGPVLSFDFWTDAPKVEILFKAPPSDSGSSNPMNKYTDFRVLVDGKIVTPDSMRMPANSKIYRLVIDFTQGGTIASASTPRRVRVDASGQSSVQFSDVVIGRADSIWAPVSDLRGMMFGDSYPEGFLRPQQYTAMSNQLGFLLGVEDMWNAGVGGTGYLRYNAGITVTWRERINDIASAAPDWCVILGSGNDIVVETTGPNTGNFRYTAAQIKAEQELFWAQATAASPNTVFFVAGPEMTRPLKTDSGFPAVNAMQAQVSVGLKDVVSKYPNCFWIETNGADGSVPWITGSGTVDAPVGDGNADRMVMGDGVHPPQPGHDYWASRFAVDIRAVARAL